MNSKLESKEPEIQDKCKGSCGGTHGDEGHLKASERQCDHGGGESSARSRRKIGPFLGIEGVARHAGTKEKRWGNAMSETLHRREGEKF